jgi:hypothetical protein
MSEGTGQPTTKDGTAMCDPDGLHAPEGTDLERLIAEVRRRFLACPAYEEFDEGLRQVNSLRVVALEVYDDLSVDAQLAVIADLISRNRELKLHRLPAEVFIASDSPMAYITDVVCEVIWQSLIDDPSIRMEDEAREAIAGY